MQEETSNHHSHHMRHYLAVQMSCYRLLGFILLLASFLRSTHTAASRSRITGPNYGIGALNRSSFPKEFFFGTASSAYQYEGAACEDGRGPSIWDTFTHRHPGKVRDGSNGDVAVDSYHRYKEDVGIMKAMGLDAYRFSISWSRLLPYGKRSMGVNRKGILYYHNLIDELTDNGIVPFVTLFHWDLPQYLEDSYGGFLSPHIVKDFRDYADLCFELYGEKVKHWITLNEPYSYSVGGYVTGELAPGRCSQWQELGCIGGDSSTEPYLVSHHQLLAHAAVVHLYRDKYQESQQGVIGITLVSQWAVPVSNEISHRNAAARALDFALGWFMDPITHGDYPNTMRSLVGDRLPKFSYEESQMLNGSFDFVGINYYTASYAANAPLLRNADPNYSTDSLVNLTVESNGTLIGSKAASDWLYVYPKGLYKLLMYIKRKYKNPLIYITENGVDEANDDKLSLQQTLMDEMRVDYYHSHLAFLHHLIKKGANVKGYFAWSLLDNFEWSNGYTVRFGINYVDYNNGLKRYPKFSASWFKRFLQKHPN